MIKWMCAVALAAAFAGPAFAQKTDLPDRPLKQIKPFDPEPIKQGIQTLQQGGECTAQFIVAANGKARDITADCSAPDMAPYVVQSIRSGEWEAEVIDGELLDSYPIKQSFKFGTASGPAVDPRGEKSPVLKTGVRQGEIKRAISQVNKAGTCNVKYTVGADGKPKDIVPNCDPAAYDEKIAEAVSHMEFEPGLKDGKPTDWPGLNTPMSFDAPN